MYKDFEGRTETEALSKAREELGLENDDVYVEILEQVKKGLFKKSYVKIRVYYGEDDENVIISDYYLCFLDRAHCRLYSISKF